jgi:hypothetical protein
LGKEERRKGRLGIGGRRKRKKVRRAKENGN